MSPQIAPMDGNADTILGLSEGIKEAKGSVAAAFELAPESATGGVGGAWEFSAEAPWHDNCQVPPSGELTSLGRPALDRCPGVRPQR